MTGQELNELFKKAIEVFGEDAQYRMVIEETSELTKEICKHFRGDNNEHRIDEEMADVAIMLSQLAIMLEIDSDEFNDILNYKAERLKAYVFAITAWKQAKEKKETQE